MWQYETTVSWTSGKEGRLHAGGNPEIMVATPPEFGGRKTGGRLKTFWPGLREAA